MILDADTNPAWPGGWGYRLGAVGGWLLFLAAVFGVVYGRAAGWPAAGLYVLAAIPALTVALQFRIAYRLIAAQDEFVRALTGKRIIVAAGATITIAVAWSVGEMAGLPHLPAWLTYPLFWALFGVVTPLVRESRA